MAYTDPPTVNTGDVAPASDWNTYIRDNMTAISHPLVVKGSDQIVSASTTLQSDNALLTPSIAASQIWRLVLILRLVHSTSGQFKMSWSIPTSSTLDWEAIGFNAAGSSAIQYAEITATDGSVSTFVCDTTPRVVRVEGLFLNGANAGAVTLRWAQNSAAGTTTVKQYSSLWGARLA
jgi:hypothetical protein